MHYLIRSSLIAAAGTAAIAAGSAAAQSLPAPALPNSADIISIDAGNFHTGRSPNGPAAVAVNLGQTQGREGGLADVNALTNGQVIDVAVNSLTRPGKTQLSDIVAVGAGDVTVTTPKDGNTVLGVNIGKQTPLDGSTGSVNLLSGSNLVEVKLGSASIAVPTFSGIPGLSGLPLKIGLPKLFGR
ncbi:hypothetical protein [Sphingomonas sp. DT-204]|uniref:hypothetical protein n=1 Tax=Sphingomonas sp. DT-204 TaxID=3396166 RepID=UPI003F1B1B6A